MNEHVVKGIPDHCLLTFKRKKQELRNVTFQGQIWEGVLTENDWHLILLKSINNTYVKICLTLAK